MEVGMVGMEPLLTVEDVADLLRCSKGSVYRLHRSGHLVGIRPTADLRFRIEDVETFLTTRRAEILG
jgi:excisionase family DNA binding protein